MATFDLPGRAIRYAFALIDRLAQLDIDVRIGLHTGETELRGDDVGGVGVHLAARVNALAGTGEALVTRTVRDLVAGSDLSVEDRGVQYEVMESLQAAGGVEEGRGASSVAV